MSLVFSNTYGDFCYTGTTWYSHTGVKKKINESLIGIFIFVVFTKRIFNYYLYPPYTVHLPEFRFLCSVLIFNQEINIFFMIYYAFFFNKSYWFEVFDKLIVFISLSWMNELYIYDFYYRILDLNRLNYLKLIKYSWRGNTLK